jgi:hypothetical protein
MSGKRRGTAEELEAFEALQARLPALFEALYADPKLPRTVVILPSLSLDPAQLARIKGVRHYEERMLCLLLLLRLRRTKVIYLSSTPIAETIIDYYLNLLPGIPPRHARRRLVMLDCGDPSHAPLTEKILGRPELLTKIRSEITTPENTHMTCFNVTGMERSLAVELGVPIYGCDPKYLPLGSKTGSRRLFRAAGVPFAPGFEDLRSGEQALEALIRLSQENPDMRRCVIKLNEGFSGEGNGLLSLEGAPGGKALEPWLRDRLETIDFVAPGMAWGLFAEQLAEMGGIVEGFIEGKVKRSPSAQFRIDPLGGIELVSTHDQVLDEESGQTFLGCRFPADKAYRLDIQNLGLKVAAQLRNHGVVGRFGVDFMSVREGDTWRHWAIEINLRKGGTTHPYLMLQFLTDGHYDPATGNFRTKAGDVCCYFASDNLENEAYKGLTPDDLFDLAVNANLHYHAVLNEGVFFHLMGALEEFGKLGVVCVAATPEMADELYERIVAALDKRVRAGIA